ncbi:UDP-glucose 4-epimerase [Spirochaetia bacterium]|nr:UDP-glucose 4-epimerase [Spirochaetia bacterium]
MTRKNILVTGGNGSLGNHVCPYLKDLGYNVASFDRFPAKPDSANSKAGIPFVQGDLTSLGDCMRAILFAQSDIIVHLGAIPFNSEVMNPFDPKYANPRITDGARFVQRIPEDATMEINTMGSFYICDAARRLGVKYIIAASSFFALGNGFRLSGVSYQPAYLPMDENHPLLPEDTYSLSKVLGEEIYKAFARAYGMQVVAMRFLGVYYHDNEFSKMAYRFNRTIDGELEVTKGNMTGNTYQYVDARDISVFIGQAIEGREKLGPFEPFFLVTDTIYTEPTIEVVKKRWPQLSELAKNIPGTEGLISHAKATKMLGYKPKYSWRDQT